ncbi:MAG: bifunctional SulP family inorganic anion transporter/carbonic anhydrase [Legionellales bacterium]|nr:bifunctional SulP family inorganic anion transporter/carbonic anhydrase [Legionellales bacterium]
MSTTLNKWQNLKFDLVSGFVVTLVAIPLCLGIALSCGVPLFAGIIPGVIGGVLVGALSQSQVSVSGPAAGLIAVVIAGIAQLGSFQAFLLALFIAGVMQLLLGVMKLGFVADYIPFNVVQGLLCAIGVTLILGQLPYTLGYTIPKSDLMLLLQQTEISLSLQPLMSLVGNIHFGAVFISLISFLVLIYWPRLKIAKFLPAPIIVVIAGVLVNLLYHYVIPSFHLTAASFLVNIEQIDNLTDLKRVLTLPSFSEWTNPTIYFMALTIMAVATLETLLNLGAAEKLDPKKRHSDRNRELLAQGLGNMTSGLLGGLPITSVVIRSSVNIETGARTKFSTIFHGIYLFLAVFILTKWINYIPLASLASILVYTGYKLSKPMIYLTMYKQGFINFFPFIVTVIAILSTDLLEGTVIGLCVAIFFILKKSSDKGFDIIKEKYPGGTVLHIMLPQQVTFLNKAALISELGTLPANSQVILDGYNVDYIDNDVIEVIQNFITSTAAEKNIALNIEGVRNLPNIENRTDFLTTTTQEIQEKMSPINVLTTLIEGNKRFVHNKLIHRNLKYQVKSVAGGQHPLAVILSCVDSRVPVEMVFDVGIGDVFCARVAGNVVDEYILGSMEFACELAGAKLLLVMGHTSCGAIKAACDNIEIGYIAKLVQKIKQAIRLETATTENRNSANDQFVLNVTWLNIEQTKKYLVERSPILSQLIKEGKLLLKGALYDVKTGKVIMDEEVMMS